MKDRNGWEKGLVFGGSIVLAFIMVLFCFWDVLPFGRTSYSVVLLGDSLIGNLNDGQGVDYYLEEMIGRPVLKGGFGGTCASFDEASDYPVAISSQLSLVKITQAIVNRDFSVPKAQIAYGQNYPYIMKQTLDYFPHYVNELANTDFKTVDYVVIEHGSNDYSTGVILDNPQDKYDESTFGGALRSSIERLQKAYPQIQIILMTPTWYCIEREEEVLYCDSTDFGGGYLEDYVNLELEIAKEYGVHVLDNYHESGINQDTRAEYLFDGLHLNKNGQMLIAGRIATFIKELEAE